MPNPSFFADIVFVPPPDANPAVQLPVAGDLEIQTGSVVNLEGRAGGTGLANSGGLGGPGGFRGGDGAFTEVNFANVEAAGLGPGGGAPGRIEGLPGPPTAFVSGEGGLYVGSDQLLPLLGGGGGGGGAFEEPGSTCQASGGGGGGGAILVAANGTIIVNGLIDVDGVAPPDPPTGSLGGVDVSVSAPGLVPIDFETSSVPAGTVVNVTVKPRVGGGASVLPVTLGTCADGTCNETVVPNLVAGRYVIEAEATFQTP
ncbi:MAG: hypothetical protein QNK04_04300 [Myxococcota bacterium]|nr:hypothetical protein [Myxococcota bacterium]